MRRVKAYYLAYAACIMALFYGLAVRDIVPYPCVNVALFLIAPAGYLYKASFSYLLIALSWLLVFPASLLLCGVDPLNAALPVLIFNGLLLGFLRCREAVRKARHGWDAALADVLGTRNRAAEELTRLRAEEDRTRTQELMIVNLYEITKKMSASLKFSDIFAILSLFLKENFTFRRCELIVVKAEGEDTQPGRVYTVWGKGQAETGGEIDRAALLTLVAAEHRGLSLVRDDAGHHFQQLCIGPGVTSFRALPLLSEKKTVAVLTVEDLAAPDVERFTILAAQFSLEIKKVLLYETVEELAITDGLTGLYVRRYFLGRVGEELNRSRRHTFRFAFIMIDIDNFKRCNDTHGHLVGDVVLKEVAQIIRQNVRQIDLVGRYGGEEFAILLPETDHENAEQVAERIRKKVAETVFTAYDEKLTMTISAGVSVYPDVGQEPWEIIDKADRALYEAKKSGKNLVRVFGV